MDPSWGLDELPLLVFLWVLTHAPDVAVVILREEGEPCLHQLVRTVVHIPSNDRAHAVGVDRLASAAKSIVDVGEAIRVGIKMGLQNSAWATSRVDRDGDGIRTRKTDTIRCRSGDGVNPYREGARGEGDANADGAVEIRGPCQTRREISIFIIAGCTGEIDPENLMRRILSGVRKVLEKGR